MSIGVSIVEDDSELRKGLAVLVQGTPGFRCVSQHASAEDALRCLPQARPQVVLMDVMLPKLSGVECVERLKASLPETQFLMLTVVDDANQILDALRAGAAGYVLKGTRPAEIMAAIEDIHRGGSPMSSSIARKVVRFFHQQKPPQTSWASLGKALTERESQVLKLLADGRRYQQIAEALHISVFTVRTHIRNIYEKLHVHSRTEAAVKFLRGRGS